MSIINNKRSGGLIVSEDVITKIAAVAAKDVDGVHGLVKHTAGVSRVFSRENIAKPVRMSVVNGVINIDVYIMIDVEKDIPTVCAEVQNSVKNAVQNMTGKVVSRVNVIVEDVYLKAEETVKE